MVSLHCFSFFLFFSLFSFFFMAKRNLRPGASYSGTGDKEIYYMPHAMGVLGSKCLLQLAGRSGSNMHGLII